MNKFYEYMATLFAVIGILLIFASVGFIETDQWLKGGAMALLGVAMFILCLYAQEESIK